MLVLGTFPSWQTLDIANLSHFLGSVFLPCYLVGAYGISTFLELNMTYVRAVSERRGCSWICLRQLCSARWSLFFSIWKQVVEYLLW